MNLTDYQRKAIQTKKPWDNKALEIADCGLGLTGEAGEVADMLKKHISGSKPFDAEGLWKLKHEIGDIMWYIAALCDAFDFDMGDIAEKNIEKLRKRHGDKFSGFGNRDDEDK
jgi:NTP pyrophosphatase (non-canonical NTP hydrolase)